MTHRPFCWQSAGAELVGEERGQGSSTIFLHGFGGTQHDWDAVWNHLDPALPALRYDLRGFGGSRALDDSPFSHADDLLALLDVRGITRANLVGTSMGGAIATQFALDHPDRVRRLVLLSPGLMGWDWSEEWRILWRTITNAARHGDMAEARRLWFAHPLFATTRADTRTAALLKASIDRYSGSEWIEDHQRAVQPDIDRLPFLTPPTLLLTGEHDLPDFRLIADLITGSAPDVERIDHAGRGHMLTLEAPEACANAIGAFLRRG